MEIVGARFWLVMGLNENNRLEEIFILFPDAHEEIASLLNKIRKLGRQFRARERRIAEYKMSDERVVCAILEERPVVILDYLLLLRKAVFTKRRTAYMGLITKGKGIIMLIEDRGNLPAGFTLGLKLFLLFKKDEE